MPTTTAGIRLREAIPTDASAITALVVLAYRVEDFFIDGDRTTLREVVALLQHDHFLLAEDADRIAGCVHIKVNGKRGYFGMLSVHPDAQGRGLGRQLVDAAEHFCSNAGCTVMDLHVVNLRRELPPWYRRLGYAEAGTEPFPDPGKTRLPCHFIIMSKPLTPLSARFEEAIP